MNDSGQSYRMDEGACRVDLNGKVAIVTGGTKGIGREISEALVQAGISVCVSARNESEIEETVASLNSLDKGSVTGSVCDVRNYDEVKALMVHCVSEFDGLDLLI